MNLACKYSVGFLVLAMVLPLPGPRRALAAQVNAIGSHAVGALMADAPAEARSVSVGSRVVRGSKSTQRYVPKTLEYELRVPTLKGATAKVRTAFERKVDQIIAAELKAYSKGALTRTEFNRMKNTEGKTMSRDEYLDFCQVPFERLTGRYTSSLYRGRYVSVVITFLGQNAACGQLGGMWNGYQSDRSVTLDTKTGAFKTLSDFTSNTDGRVSAAVGAWYAKESHKSLANRPKVSRRLLVCDRPANVHTDSPQQKACYADPYNKSGLVAWLLEDRGLRLTFPAANGPRYATIRWTQVAQPA
jgi:hypothetical protein